MSNLLDKASVILTPTAYNTSEALCVKPSDGSGDFDFSRATEATRINSLGLIETIGINLPRINYEGGCGSWLWEPQSTNLFTQSELFTDASWNEVQTTIEAASITLPNGLTNGYKLFANTTLTNHWFEKTPFPTATTGQDYTLSLFVKSAGSDFIQMAASGGFTSRYQNFNISTGTKASGDISDSSITDFGNGWYRISVTETTTSATARYLIVPILSDGSRNPQFAGNANEDGVYIWGAMLEQNSYATSYIPTSGSQVTRNQDVCTGGGSLATINSTEGTLYFEGSALFNGKDARISLSDGSISNRVSFAYAPTANKAYCIVRFNGVQVIQNLNVSLGVSQTDNIKVAIRYKTGNSKMFVNGVSVVSSIANYSTASPPLSELKFENATGGIEFEGKNKCLAVWKEALTDAELTELTTI